MSSWIRGMLAALIALSSVVFGTMAAAASPTTTPVNVHAFSYNAQHHGVVAGYATTERGPPANYVRGRSAIAVDHGSRGAAASSGPATSPATPTYDHALLARGARSPSAIDQRWAWGDSGAFSPLGLSGVAAKGATAVGDDWPVISGIVRDAAKGKGNFGLGSGTASQAERAGQSWLGEGWRWSSDGKAMVSQDGLRVYRPPTFKPNQGGYQANLEWRDPGAVTNRMTGNGHLDITDMFP